MITIAYILKAHQYKTNSGQIYPLDVGVKCIESVEIVHDYRAITHLCRKGCKNFNYSGGCPPRAPKFEVLQKKYKYAVLQYARIFSSCKPARVKESNSYFIHYKSQDVVLSNYLTKQGNSIIDCINNNDFIFLNNGYCMGCGNKKCAFKNGEKRCNNPKRRTFSLEATGINVEATLYNTFRLSLQWYNKENYKQVEYMTKAVGFFCKSSGVQASIFRLIKNSLR